MELPVLEIAQPRRKTLSDQSEEGKYMIARTSGIGKVLLDLQDGVVVEQAVENIGSRTICSQRPEWMRACSRGSISSARMKAILSVSVTRLVAPGASGADRSQWNRVCRISGSTVKRSSRDWSFSAERPDIRAASARRRAITRPAKPIRSIVSGAGSNTFRSRSVVTIAWAIEWPLSVAVAVSTADSKAARRSCAVAVRFPK